MKRRNIIHSIIGSFIILFLLGACSEDELTPSGANDNKFAVPEGQNDAVSKLRKEFHDKNNIHLLFTDTLKREYIGKDAFGDDVWAVETVDLTYNLTASSGDNLSLEYLDEEEEMKNAIELVEKQILPHIGGSMLPYSILLVKSIQRTDSYGDIEDLAVQTNMRCLAIAVGEWLDMDEDEQAEQGQDILIELIQNKFSYTSDAAEPFLAFCNDLYYEDIIDYIPDWDRNIEDIYELGMLSYGKDWDSPEWDWFVADRNDFNEFFNAVMRRTEEDFAEEYGNYPIIMQKYRIMRDTIIELGYKF